MSGCLGHADRSYSDVMNSCGNANASTKLRGSKTSETREEPAGNSQDNNEGKSDGDRECEADGDGDGDGDADADGDSNNPRQPLLICHRNSTGYSSDRPVARLKSRYNRINNPVHPSIFSPVAKKLASNVQMVPSISAPSFQGWRWVTK